MIPMDLFAADARALALSYAATVHPSSPAVGVADVVPLTDGRGWVAWLQTEAYLASGDPLDFLPMSPLLVLPGPTIQPLPTAFPVRESLASLGLALDEE